MGYDLHITRADDWGESELQPIAWQEWKVVVEEDSELVFSETDWIRFENQSDNQPLVDWHGTAAEEACLYWFEGRVVAKHPSDALIDKMVGIAERLGATVRGDDGEHYPLSEEELATRGCLVSILFLVSGSALAAVSVL